ncbi:MAG: NUDIX hydrolase [Blastochloris viridis]|uniref:NUDIX hydrolase n=1 Tax=Blastochloris viridis TaxID=1079 RepID=A0A6N4R551_BLAVI|nr:MAG: NUDIX hydrolase [Blastochloris viridis]
MSNPHNRRRKSRPPRKSGQQTGGSDAAATKKAPPPNKGPSKRTGRGRMSASKSRWFYDVRQYALLTDDAGNLLILQLPKEYDATAANTWTLPGGKLEPTDEPGEGLLREISEETGLTGTLVGPAGVARWTSRNSKKLGIFWRATVPGTKPNLKLSKEHQRAVWISPSEVGDFPFHRPEMLDVVKKLNSDAK